MLFDQTLNGLFDTDISFKRIFSQGGGGGGGGVFSHGQGTEWGIFSGVAKISNIFGGA